MADCNDTPMHSATNVDARVDAQWSSIGVILWNDQGTVIRVNDVCARWLEQSAASLVGSRIDQLLHGRFESLLSHEQPGDSQWSRRLRRFDGVLGGNRIPTIPLVGFVACLESSPGVTVWAAILVPHEVQGCVVQDSVRRILQPATSDSGALLEEFNKLRRRYTLQAHRLAVAKNKLKRALSTKQQFLALVSHELRTPLHGTLGMLDLLAATPMSTKQRSYLKVAQGTSRTMLEMVNDMIELTDLRSGAMGFRKSRCDFPECINQAFCEALNRPHCRNVTLVRLIEPSAYVRIECDVRQLEKVLVKLIDQAVRFSLGNRLILHARCLFNNLETAKLLVTIVDSESGIASNHERRSVQAFAGSHPSGTYGTAGLGLGLVLGQELAQQMGGKIRCRTRIDVGSAFVLCLHGRILEKATLARTDLKPLQGLLIWDCRTDALERRHLSRCLRRWGATYLSATFPASHSGFKVLSKTCSTCLPSVVVVDVSQVRDRNQLEAVAEEYGISVVQTTNQSHNQEQLAACNAFDTARLFDIFTSILRPSQNPASPVLRQEPPQQQSSAESPTTSSESQHVTQRNPYRSSRLPRIQGNVLVVEDNPVNQLYLKELLTLLGCSCQIAADGPQALQAVEDNCFDLVLLDCHMPEIDGFCVAHQIRRRGSDHGTGPNVPIIGISATYDRKILDRAKNAGMTEFLAKPVDGDQLRSLLERYLSPRTDTN